jgi:hypothetical protein
MATCPLCSDRAAKRFCPAKDTQICAVCCGTKREIEIDCPSSCVHLKAGRSYEADKRDPDPELAAKLLDFDAAFLKEYSPILDAISRAVVEEHRSSRWLVDNDVIEVYKALASTMKTLSSGIYYESLPDGSVRQSLFRRVKELLDGLMGPQQDLDGRTLKASEAIQVLDFLTLAALINSGARPLTRRYLDWLASMTGAGPGEQSTGLIIP